MRRTISMTNAFFASRELGTEAGLDRFLYSRGVSRAEWNHTFTDCGGGKVLVLEPKDQPSDEDDGAPSSLIANQDGALLRRPAFDEAVDSDAPSVSAPMPPSSDPGFVAGDELALSHAE